MSLNFKDPRDIIIAPVVSEKTYSLMDEGKYTFIVDPRANKTEIKIAVEKVFDVKVTSVNTINRPGKTRRTRNGLGKRKDTKRAIVSLAPGDRIEEFAPRGVVLSGGPASVTTDESPRAPDAVFAMGVPVLGICYGQQTLAAQLGGALF